MACLWRHPKTGPQEALSGVFLLGCLSSFSSQGYFSKYLPYGPSNRKLLEKQQFRRNRRLGHMAVLRSSCRRLKEADADAQVKVGLCYGKGIGVTQDYEKAFTWVMKSAEQGNALGAYLVADCYMQGKGVEQNIPQAMEWFTKAANQGIAIAQYNLGAIYLKGLFDIPKDEKKAFFWTEKAANQGDKEAQYNLGISYCNGLGVPKNLEKAFYWFEKAAEQGEPNAQASLGLLYLNDDKDVSSVFTQASKYYWSQQEAERRIRCLEQSFPR